MAGEASTDASRLPYRHRQFGWLIAAAMAVALVLATALVRSLGAPTIAAAGWAIPALYALIVAGFALTGWLVVRVDADAVRVRFGVGLVRRRIDVADIVGCERVRTRLRWGWGLHWTPSGWLYNVSGRDAVRIELRGERAVMVGSDDAGGLLDAIEAARAARRADGRGRERT
jgi:hypothetical protein